MPILFRDGFESGDTSLWDIIYEEKATDVMSVITSWKQHGKYSANCFVDERKAGYGGEGSCYLRDNFTAVPEGTERWARAYVQIDGISSLEPANLPILWFGEQGVGGILWFGFLRTGGVLKWALRFYHGGWQAAQTSVLPFAPELNTVYLMELYYKFYRNTVNGIATAWVNNQQVFNQTGIKTGDRDFSMDIIGAVTITRFPLGEGGINVKIDDYKFADVPIGGEPADLLTVGAGGGVG